MRLGQRKSHCKNGHPRTPDNLVGSTCRTCKEARLGPKTPKPPRPPKEACINGHIRAPGSMTKNGGCKRCQLIAQAERQAIMSAVGGLDNGEYSLSVSPYDVMNVPRMEGATYIRRADKLIVISPRGDG